MADLQMPETEEYRVVSLGATYFEPIEGFDVNTGKPTVQYAYRVVPRGTSVNLVAREAARLKSVGAVLPAGSPLTYDEMDDKALAAESQRRGLSLRGQGVGGEPIREDYINALNNSDRGAVIAASDPSGVVSVTSQAELQSGSGGQVPLALDSSAGSYDVAALAEQISSGGDGGKSLNVEETVALAGDDPAAAQAVLEAESTANGGDPRSTVESRLRAIINRG